MKYPKTFHLPHSGGVCKDDRVLKNTDHLIGREVIYTEKLDGECTCFGRMVCHARSEDSRHHESRSWVKGVWSRIRWMIPENFLIFGENVYAKHSIFYDQLTTYFYVFGVVDESRKMFLSVDDCVDFSQELGLQYAPILKKGTFDPNFEVPKKSTFGEKIEGFVVRVMDEFGVEKMDLSVAKWVRKGHVQTEEHWTERWIPNQLTKQGV